MCNAKMFVGHIRKQNKQKKQVRIDWFFHVHAIERNMYKGMDGCVVYL